MSSTKYHFFTDVPFFVWKVDVGAAWFLRVTTQWWMDIFFQFLLVVLSVRAGGGIYFKSCFRCLKDSVLFCADILPQLPLL